MDEERTEEHSVADSGHPDPARPRIFKTRRAELLSGLTLASIFGIYAAVRTITSDIDSLITTKNAHIERRLDTLERLIESQRRERREEMKELKRALEADDERLERRLQWLERAIPQMPRK